jgi:hypothetical protein
VLQFFIVSASGGAVAQLGARLDGIEEVVGSNPIGSTKDKRTRPGETGKIVGPIPPLLPHFMEDTAIAICT